MSPGYLVLQEPRSDQVHVHCKGLVSSILHMLTWFGSQTITRDFGFMDPLPPTQGSEETHNKLGDDIRSKNHSANEDSSGPDPCWAQTPSLALLPI
jgi:hypothetical protein